MADHRVVLTASGSTSSQSAKRTLAPAPGVTPPPTDGSSYRFLSDVIIARGLVEPAAMKAALQASLAGRSLTEILVDNGELSEDDLARTLAEHHRLDHVDLDVFAVDEHATALVEPDVARRFGAVPIARLASGTVVVALYDPNGSTAVLEFAGLTDRVIQPAVASRTQIEALIDSLRRRGRVAPGPPAPAAPETHLRSVPAGDIVISPATEHASAAPLAQPAVPPPEPAPAHGGPPAHAAAPPPATSMRDTDHYDARFDDHRDRAGYDARHDDRRDRAPHDRGAHDSHRDRPAYDPRDDDHRDGPTRDARHDDPRDRGMHDSHRDRAPHDHRLDELRDRAEAAERRSDEAEDRARAAEERARAAEEQVRGADELTRLAEARAKASDERALAAGELVDAAEARAEGMSSAADAANETLARLVRACETLEREAQSRGPELDMLRTALDAERSQRAQLETQLRYPQPSEELMALKTRIAELERALADRRTAVAAPPVAEQAPAPVPAAEVFVAPAPPPVPAPAPLPAAQVFVAPPAPPPVPAPAPPAAQVFVAPAPPPVPAPAPPAAQVFVVPDPPPVPAPVAPPEAPQAPVVAAYVPPAESPTIDIVGEPGVPYVSALAPMPSNDVPVRNKAPRSASAKARGLRRLISAIKRGA